MIDFSLSLAIVPAAYIMKYFREASYYPFPQERSFPRTADKLKNIGVFPIISHFYEPYFGETPLKTSFDQERALPGLNLEAEKQLEFLAELSYNKEIIELNWDKKSDANMFYINNMFFESGDAEFLYQFIRRTKPNKMIEIGGGHSTKVAISALNKNLSDHGIKCSHICIEPHENDWLETLEGTTVLRSRVEDTPIDWRNELHSGDFLFIDSSHMIKPQGDVLKEYLEIIPSLASGVYVHVHDIFTPRDYPKAWLIDENRFWNEQYLLEAVVSNSARYQIVAALNFLKHNYYAQLSRVCPHITPKREPGSFYFRVR